MAAEESYISAKTHTALRDRLRRLWSFNDLSLPGLSIPGLQAGFGVFVVLVVAGWMLHSVLGGITLTIAFIIAISASVTVYFVWGRSVTDLGGAGVTLVFWGDYQFRQPRKIRGSGANREPTRVRWQVTFWEPTDPGWHARRDATYQWLIDHAPADTATAAAKRPTPHDHDNANFSGEATA